MHMNTLKAFKVIINFLNTASPHTHAPCMQQIETELKIILQLQLTA